MRELVNTPIDQKNIKLAKIVKALRQELDIYCLISVNADGIKESGIGKAFFWYVRSMAITSITLSICKIYEDEKRNELNSISGIIRHLRKESALPLNTSIFESFIRKYNVMSTCVASIDLLNITFNNFRLKYKNELDRFKTFRNKYAAHSDYGFPLGTLPSYDVMQKLFLFAFDFCELVYEQFIGVGIVNMDGREVKSSLERLFKELGCKDIKTEMQ